MGVVRRQGINNSIFLYIGLVLGYINLGFLMTKLLPTENLGLRNVVFQVGSMFSVISLVGGGNILNRFFPAFRNKETQHGGLFTFISLYWFVGCLFTSIVFYAFQDNIIDYYMDKSPLIVKYYGYIVPFGIFLSLYELLSAYSRVLLKSTFPIFLRDFCVRLYTTVLLLGIVFFHFTFNTFFLLYLLGYALSAGVMLFYLYGLGEIKFSSKKNWAWLARKREMFVFGFYTWFNNSMNVVVKTADITMITYYVGLAATGVYGLGALIGNVVVIPAMGLRQITGPVVSNMFEEKREAELPELYRKTSMIQLIMGLLAFLLIVVNLEVLLPIWRPEFMESKWVVYTLGGAKLIEMSLGINNRIIMESKYFRVNFYFNLFMGVLVIVTNIIFIKQWGMIGAAVASALTIVVINGGKMLFVYSKFRCQPYTAKSLLAVGIGIVAFFASYYIHPFGSIPVDIFIRTVVFCLVFVPLIIFLKVSEDVNKLLIDVAKRFKIMK